MAINVPSSISDLSTGDYILGEPILSDDFDDIKDRLHYLYAHSGGRGMGHIWDPPWKRSSETLGVEPDNFARPLDHAHTPLQLVRPARGADNWPATVLVHVEDTDLEVEVFDVKDATSIRTTTTTITGKSWAAISYTFTDAEADAGGRRAPLEIRLRAAASGSNVTSKIRQFCPIAAILTASDMPID